MQRLGLGRKASRLRVEDDGRRDGERRSASLAAAEQKPDRRLIRPWVNEANLNTPKPAGDRRKAIRQPVRPVNDAPACPEVSAE